MKCEGGRKCNGCAEEFVGMHFSTNSHEIVCDHASQKACISLVLLCKVAFSVFPGTDSLCNNIEDDLEESTFSSLGKFFGFIDCPGI